MSTTGRPVPPRIREAQGRVQLLVALTVVLGLAACAGVGPSPATLFARLCEMSPELPQQLAGASLMTWVWTAAAWLTLQELCEELEWHPTEG
ncbi:hypothetical protein [Ramlibacter alkalitolerans]|uniref:Uncharacterized protein n=1 Tax=Ramlibacter alkalitolerans TaxID=2039631 RepID=A0ABS1JTW2_9BURK|nr:hypothetical protein [Ramlibacter alkalitolerans]MBL0427672.1 hypothetical protein [Ramlibacter alkalitolerans]